jgi:hypothetical protein
MEILRSPAATVDRSGNEVGAVVLREAVRLALGVRDGPELDASVVDAGQIDIGLVGTGLALDFRGDGRAVAVVGEPRFVDSQGLRLVRFLDEPTTGLDPRSR